MPNQVIAVPATHTMRAIPTEVHLDRADGMPARCVFAPCDYVVSDHTVLQPDVLVVHRAELGDKNVERTPALVVEVVSAATRRVDLGTKRLAYEAARVPSYWLVDPDEPSLTVLELREGAYAEAARVRGDDVWEGTTPFAVRIVPAELVR